MIDALFIVGIFSAVIFVIGFVLWLMSSYLDESWMRKFSFRVTGISFLLIVACCVVGYLMPTPPTQQEDVTITGKNQYWSASCKCTRLAIYAGTTEYGVSLDQYNAFKEGDNVRIVLQSGSIKSITRR